MGCSYPSCVTGGQDCDRAQICDQENARLLKFDDIREGMILVSPWGSEVKVNYGDEDFIGVYITGFESKEIMHYEFNTVFGGWKIKEKE